MVTSHVDHVIGFGVLDVFQLSPSSQFVVGLFLIAIWKSEGRLFLRCLSEHRVEGGVILYHQPAFQPVTSFVSLVENVSANTCTFRSITKSQLSIEVSSNDGYAFIAISHVFLDRFVHFLYVMVRIPRVVEVHTHQFDVLSVNHDRGSDGTFVDVFGLDNSLIPTPCLLSNFPDLMKMCL